MSVICVCIRMCVLACFLFISIPFHLISFNSIPFLSNHLLYFHYHPFPLLTFLLSISIIASPHLSPPLPYPLSSSPHLTSPHLTSPHLTSPHLTSPYPSPCLTSPNLSTPHHLSFSSPHYDRMNVPTDQTRWFMTPQTINAYYHPSLNEIVFPAAILQVTASFTSTPFISILYIHLTLFVTKSNLSSYCLYHSFYLSSILHHSFCNLT
jgi:hypothetical protein